MTASFFFSSFGDPRTLHSFPTRRSSDLAQRQSPPGDLERGATDVVFRVGKRDGQLLHAGAGLCDGHRHLRPPGDRKSTRLNSSHTVISYAVFCLKKKHTVTIKSIFRIAS